MANSTPQRAKLPKLLSIGQFAKVCGVPYQTARNWVLAGKVRSRVFKKAAKYLTYRVPRGAAIKFSEDRRQGLPL